MTQQEWQILKLERLMKQFNHPDQKALLNNFPPEHFGADAILTDVFEINFLGDDHVYLVKLMEDREIGPLILNEQLIGLLEPGDTFFMILGRYGSHWKILFTSGLYNAHNL